MSNQQLNLRKIGIKLIILLIFLSYIIFSLGGSAFAITQTKKPYSANDLANYPGFQEKIEALKAAHPNWNFTILYTDIDWNEAIRNETTARHGRSLVPASKTGEWLCPVCGDIYDTGKWLCASDIAVAYYMDPRNFLNEDYIFMFEDLGFNATNQSIEGVETIIKDATYLDAQMIMNAAKDAGISPYHLASRIVQEQGNGSQASSTGSGTYPGYEGFYNYLNIGATGSGENNVITNALEYAKSHGWTSPEISIRKGAEYLAKNFIGRGQSTLYLQKFDVDNQEGSLYEHQYMQNIMAPASESSSIKKSYQQLGAFDKNSNFKINFVIPVYRNMPSTPCREPQSSGEVIANDIVTEDVEITGDGVNVRSEKSTSSESIAKLNKGDRVLRIEKANKEINGYKWDCIVLSDGRKGYISSGYVKKIDTITNCNETVELTGTGVYVRNGPGKDKTTVITSLSRGQTVTRIEKGKYKNIDGYDWDRIVLSDGRSGYIASNYLAVVEKYTGDNLKQDGENLVCEPKVTVENIKKTYPNATVKDAAGNVVTTGNVGTGYVVTVGTTQYTVVKYGDATGNGKIDSADLLAIQRHLLEKANITDKHKLKAADATGNGKVDSADLLAIQKHLLGKTNITI